MLKQACALCKVVGALAGIGALNWGLTALFGINLVDKIFGEGSGIGKIVYALVGLSGLLLLASFVMVCPACKKS